jgi:basic amino acid/polyamine antiporter, APA family
MKVPLDYASGSTESAQPKLARTMGPWALILYGVGDMLGAGIYGLVGKAAGMMGNAVWLAFAASMVAAMLTGLSYACIGSRYPRAAGAAFVTQHAYRVPFISYVIGLAVAASGLTSMATGSRVIGGYAHNFGLALPVPLIATIFLLMLALVVFWGIRQSTWLNVICTVVEVSGLLIVIGVGLRYWGSVNYLEFPRERARDGAASLVLLTLNGAVLTFFSFIGFEDILNVSEEVKEPRRTIPIGLIGALIIATIIYMAVSITAVSVVPYADLAASKGPLVDVVKVAAPWFHDWVFAAIAMFAVANTALLNYVMGSRLLYGMSRQGLLPGMLGKVHAKRRTPHVAIVALLVVVLILVMVGTIQPLAEATALLLLIAFVVVNSALVVLKLRLGEPKGAFEVPVVVPVLGALVCLTLIVLRLYRAATTEDHVERIAPIIAAAIIGGAALLFLVLRPKNVTEETLAEIEHEH